MYLQVRELVLWPRNPQKTVRTIKFQPGAVNVISGSSRTGKSAIIPIIDYCLAAGTCSIPVQTIRKHCEWFGVVIATKSGEKLLARREPGAQRSTDDMFLLEAASIDQIPERLAKNISADAVRRLLDEWAGLSNLDFSGGEERASGFEGRPSFRDMAAFVFQPQNVIANPDILFFKTNTYEHREKLRKIFPYVLGASTPALMAMQHQLRATQQELRRKQRELQDARAVSAQWMADLGAKYSEAQELGLVTRSDATLSREQMLDELSQVIAKPQPQPLVSGSTISNALQELAELEAEERTISRQLTGLRHRLEEMRRLRRGSGAYVEALGLQRDRLQLSRWLASQSDDEPNCPICGSHTDSAKRKLSHLVQRLAEIEAEAGVDSEVPAAFEREFQRVTSELGQATESLRAVQVRKRALSARSDEARSSQYAATSAERFLGGLEAAIHLHRRLGTDAELAEEVARLAELERDLRERLQQQNIETRTRRALRIIDTNAARLLPFLDVERPNDPVSLQINDLTIKVAGAERDDYLHEIGSGSNWLSYHLAVLLGLQQYFLSQPNSPVPALLVIDQPSQVYFPKKAAERESDRFEDDPQFTRDEDIEAVRKAFRVMAKVVGESDHRLQVIVLDHAASDVWGTIQGVVTVEEWRGGLKLVPQEWLE